MQHHIFVFTAWYIVFDNVKSNGQLTVSTYYLFCNWSTGSISWNCLMLTRDTHLAKHSAIWIFVRRKIFSGHPYAYQLMNSDISENIENLQQNKQTNDLTCCAPKVKHYQMVETSELLCYCSCLCFLWPTFPAWQNLG